MQYPKKNLRESALKICENLREIFFVNLCEILCVTLCETISSEPRSQKTASAGSCQ
jgi:hypothetical protein